MGSGRLEIGIGNIPAGLHHLFLIMVIIEDNQIFMKNFIILLTIFLVISGNSSDASVRCKYLKLLLVRSPNFERTINVIGYLELNSYLLLFPNSTHKYSIKFYYVSKDNDTINNSVLKFPRFFYTNILNENFINCETKIFPTPIQSKYKKYKLILEVNDDNTIISKYISNKMIKL